MERRSSTRIKSPGTKVQLRRLNGLGVFNVLSKPTDIVDISKSGVSFKVSETVDSGQPVEMRLTFPDGKSFNLKGKIRWFEENGNNHDTRIGIQFLPFGSSRKYNPLKALDYLRNMDGQKVEKIIRNENNETDDSSDS